MTEPPRQPVLRTVPRQQRSRERYDLVLDSADELLAESGYDAFTTTAVAARAGVTPSTVYRWFADKDELAAALVLRHNERVDEQTAARLADLGDEAPLADAVACVYNTYVDYYRAHPSHVILWFQGRIGRAAAAAVHEHTGRVTEFTLRHAIEHGRLPASVTVADVRLMAEAVDRIHEYAFREDPRGDPDILRRGLVLAQRYYEGLE